LNTRAFAAEVLRQVVGDRKSLTAVLEESLKTIPSEKDRTFVQALTYGVLRWYERLDFILGQLLRKPVKQAYVHMLALIGLYQLQYTRVKPHAAVSETVAAAKVPWAKSLLNAVLRTYQRDRAHFDALAENDVSAAAAHPAWMIQEIRTSWPHDCAEILRQNTLPPPMSLRVNQLKCSRERYLLLLEDAGIAAYASPIGDSAIVLESPVTINRLPGFAEGWVSVQDVAAQLAAPLLDLRSSQRVLDACAAPGGKTLHILETCPQLKELVAVDNAPARLEKVRQNLAREGLRATLLAADMTRPADWWDGEPFHRILLDAPCSATGVIRRHPDIKVLRKPEHIAGLRLLQRNVLEAAWRMLVPGGLLLYVTCSILRSENEEQIEHFLAAHADARDVPIMEDFGQPAGHGRQILTGQSGMDGFYYARLGKLAA
jgi:16S rRNA (cytosine967-C5)-methyltransferase